MTEAKNRKSGRPTKSPDGKRVTFHLSLSPGAFEALTELCKRPIAPLEKSAMIEHLILERAGQSRD